MTSVKSREVILRKKKFTLRKRDIMHLGCPFLTLQNTIAYLFDLFDEFCTWFVVVFWGNNTCIVYIHFVILV